MAGWVFRENRVPHYQHMFQNGSKQHVRQWVQTPRSKLILYPYYVVLWGSFGCTMYAMGRLVLGHKTWFSQG